MKIRIPVWLWIVIVLETLPLFLGPIAALNRPTLMGGPEAETLTLGAWMYVARNGSVGLAFLLAAYLRNAPMLFILIFVRLFTDIVDLPSLMAYGQDVSKPRVIGIFFFLYYVPAVVALRYLWGQLKDTSPVSEPA